MPVGLLFPPHTSSREEVASMSTGCHYPPDVSAEQWTRCQLLLPKRTWCPERPGRRLLALRRVRNGILTSIPLVGSGGGFAWTVGHGRRVTAPNLSLQGDAVSSMLLRL